MSRCWRGAHRSMSVCGEVARRWRRAAVTRAQCGSGGGRERARERGGNVRSALGVVLALYRGQGAPRRRQWAKTTGVNGLNAIDGQGEVKQG
jgi:hypothetical protein